METPGEVIKEERRASSSATLRRSVDFDSPHTPNPPPPTPCIWDQKWAWATLGAAKAHVNVGRGGSAPQVGGRGGGGGRRLYMTHDGAGD